MFYIGINGVSLGAMARVQSYELREKVCWRSCLLLFISILGLLSSCATPQKVYDQGNYRHAIKLAMKEIAKNKNVALNRSIINRSSNQIARQRVDDHQIVLNSSIREREKQQTDYFEDLELLGKVHLADAGDVLNEYDAICNLKLELDLAIVDYYYWGADSLLLIARQEGDKASAREAYRYLEKCKESSGETYYTDISLMVSEAFDLGTVYFVAHGVSPSTSLFRQPLPADSNIQADCEVTVSCGTISKNHSTTRDHTTYTKEIEARKEMYTDTSGQLQTRSIMEEVSAIVTTITHVIKVSQRVEINVSRLTEHCDMYGDSETITFTETLEEVTYTGDQEAVPSHIQPKSAYPHNTEVDLEREVKAAVDQWIRRY